MIITDLLYWFREQIYNYNLFVSDETGPEIGDSELKRQRYATRLYVPLLIIIFYVLFFIAFINPQSRLKTISNITPTLFNQLRMQYGQTLACPCSTTSMNYKDFVSNSISFHPVCTSTFVNQTWIKALYFANASAYLVMDFRSTAYSQFELLAGLCKFCQQTISQVVLDLENKTLVTPQLLSEYEFQSQISKDVELIQTSTPIQALLSLYFLQTITQSNSFVSALNTNVAINVYFHQEEYVISSGFTIYNAKNSSGLSTVFLTCQSTYPITPAGIYEISYEKSADFHVWWPSFIPSFEPKSSAMIDGFFGACTPIDALLMSTLDCLYDSNCLKLLPNYFPGLRQINSSWMNVLSASTQQNTTVKENLNNLFTEQWSADINYTIYFRKCAPPLCTYTETNRMNLYYTITLLLSLYGGLTIVLRLLSMLLINMVFKFHFNQIRTYMNMQRIRRWTKELNIFASKYQRTLADIREQHLATRIYLVLLGGSYLVLLLYTSLNTQLITKSTPKPSLAEYENLGKLYSRSLQCPCSNITISYSTLTSFQPTLHKICSSAFISDSWIAMMKLLQIIPLQINWNGLNGQHILLLSNLCQRANKTIVDAIHRFNETSFSTLNVLTKETFDTVMETTVNQFIQSLVINFNLFINTSHLFTQIDQPLTTVDDSNIQVNATANNQSETQLSIIMNTLKNNDTSDTCICSTNSHCQKVFALDSWQWGIFSGNKTDGNSLSTIPGMVSGCFVIDSLLQSTLECFYSNQCLSALYYYMNSTFVFMKQKIQWFTAEPLIYDPTVSKFTPNTTLQIITKEMFVEQWNYIFFFEHYYEACAPSYCTYPHITHMKSPLEIVATLISSLAGLTFAFRLITSIIIKLLAKLFRRKVNRQQQVRRKLFIQMKNVSKNLISLVRSRLVNLNLFPHENFNDNISRIRNVWFGRLATRLYIVLLITGLAILILYTIIQPHTLTKVFVKPSLEDYTNLIVKENKSLHCPCSSISSMYSQYISIEPTFHQICSSPFATDQWRVNITANLDPDVTAYERRDYRRYLSAHLQFLTGLCELSTRSVRDSVEQFLSSQYITIELQTPTTFQLYIDLLVKQSQKAATIAVNNFIGLLRDINHGNAIISTYESNFEYYIPSWYNTTYFFGILALGSLALTEPLVYDDECSCGLTSSCTSQATFLNISVKGLKIGCAPSESFLASTLECFYDMSCIQIIQEQVNCTNHIISILNITNRSRFFPNTTVIKLINELFIETWSVGIDYSRYFHSCSPVFCSYTYTQRLSPLYTVTLVLGLHGGLSVVLKWLCPKLIYLFVQIYYYRKRRSNFIQPVHTTELSTIENSTTTRTTTSSIRTTDHSKFITISSTAEFSMTLLRFLCVGVMMALCITMAFIGPFIYLRQQEEKQTIALTSSNSTILSTIVSTSSLSTVITTTTVTTSPASSCELTLQLRFSYATGSGAWPKSAAIDDFNGDGYQDIAIANFYANNIVIFYGNGSGAFKEQMRLSTGFDSGPNLIIANDFNNDHLPDIAVNNNNDYSVGIFFSNLTGTFQDPITLPTEERFTVDVFTIADFNRDNQLDFAVMNMYNVGILLGNNDGTFQTQMTFSIQGQCSTVSATTADFNGDSQLDLAFVCIRESLVIVAFGCGNGSFSSQIQISTGETTRPVMIVASDFNSDNYSDIAIVNSIPFNIGVVLANANGTFHEQMTYSTGTNSRPNALVAGDFNNDNRIDLAIANRDMHNVGVMFGIDDGRFMEQIAFSIGDTRAPFSITASDLNNDGKLDIIVTDMAENTLNILLNTCDDTELFPHV